jgi:hypothetical protein
MHRFVFVSRPKWVGNVRCVTNGGRKGRKMSHPFRACLLWHGCCSYLAISGTSRILGSKQARKQTKKARIRNKNSSPDTERTG